MLAGPHGSAAGREARQPDLSQGVAKVALLSHSQNSPHENKMDGSSTNALPPFYLKRLGRQEKKRLLRSLVI